MHDIEHFIAGFKRFRERYFDQQPALYRRLCEAQRPGTLLIGCCDSRVDPALLLGCDPGDIFTLRNVANLVPPYCGGGTHQSVLAAVQFAVEQLQVDRVIVLGHSQCGGIRVLVEQEFANDDEAGVIGRWLGIAAPVRTMVKQQMPQASVDEQRRACELASILVSLKNLESYSCVHKRMEQKAVTLHGWYFDMNAGALLAYSPDVDAFLPLVCPYVPELDNCILA